MSKRVFKKTSQYAGLRASIISQIDRWEWTPGHGLRVFYLDGLSCKSDYTLPELLSPSHPEGYIREIFGTR